MRVFLWTLVLMAVPLCAGAQGPSAASKCADDSTLADLRRVDVLRLTDSSGTVQWLRPTRALCEAARKALGPDSARGAFNPQILVYAIGGFDSTQYAVVQRRTAEAGADFATQVCFYNRRWRKYGLCVAM